jgi:hypothetical protein
LNQIPDFYFLIVPKTSFDFNLFFILIQKIFGGV